MAEGRGSTDQRATKDWAARDPESFGRLIDLLADCVSWHLIRQLQAGADAVQIFDSWAGGLNEQMFAQWVIAPTKTIVERVRAAVPEAKIIGFPRATTLAGYAHYARETGVNAISVDTSASLGAVRRAIGDGFVVQGNLDPQVLVAGGDALDESADAILAGMHGTPFIFNLGHGVVPQTPPEHVAAIGRAREGFVKLAVVLFNLGGPDRPEAVEPFLRNLFSDPAIIALPAFLGIPLGRFIASRRAPFAETSTRRSAGARPSSRKRARKPTHWNAHCRHADMKPAPSSPCATGSRSAMKPRAR